MNIIINNKEFSCEPDETVLDVALKNNIYIPTLCFLKGVHETSDCRMCLVSADGILKTACSLKVKEGMKVDTELESVSSHRRNILDLIISDHHFDCMNCSRGGKCELKTVMKNLNVESSSYNGEKNNFKIDSKSPSITRDFNKCILCKRCLDTCNNIQKIGAIDVASRGFSACISTTNNLSLNDVNCTFCGQCINNCPTGALKETSSYEEVIKMIKDPKKVVYVQTAPSIRAALGEEFGLEIGTNVTAKMVTALRKLGFDKVFDTNVGADFTIMEEASELVMRIKNKKTLPMITSCSPAWIRFIEMNYPEYLDNISSCKSPHQMLGALLKNYYPLNNDINIEDIYVVSVMPCISKKFEITRDGNEVNEIKDVDAVITTRELAKMIKDASIDFVNLEDSKFDTPFEDATGAGAIFGNTGGVMEAALRTAAHLLNDSKENLIFNEVRGDKGLKKTSVNINGFEYNFVVASGLSNARKVLEEVKNGAKYHFIEVMACPGGCIMGGGQPIVTSNIKSKIDVRNKRATALYEIDENSTYRKSHENRSLIKIYKEYLGIPGQGMAHKLLHTKFSKRNKYNFENIE